jgi:hypothetical protein
MTKPTNLVSHREAGAAGRGDPLGLPRRPAPRNDRSGTSLWLWVAGAFLFLGLLWTALFIAAKSARIETVPLAPKGARP